MLNELRNWKHLSNEGHDPVEILQFSAALFEERVKILEEMKNLLSCALKDNLLSADQKSDFDFAIQVESGTQHQHVEFMMEIAKSLFEDLDRPGFRGSRDIPDTFEL